MVQQELALPLYSITHQPHHAKEEQKKQIRPEFTNEDAKSDTVTHSRLYNLHLKHPLNCRSRHRGLSCRLLRFPLAFSMFAQRKLTFP